MSMPCRPLLIDSTRLDSTPALSHPISFHLIWPHLWRGIALRVFASRTAHRPSGRRPMALINPAGDSREHSSAPPGGPIRSDPIPSLVRCVLRSTVCRRLLATARTFCSPLAHLKLKATRRDARFLRHSFHPLIVF